ncbi:hypothetical protein BDV93DRAFT_563169 [Ceratobasidium sp. AG-I]|nr:hypothetical protein BDV93DRAFT_563169 [Ceratobasidium sp. AG-I]
MILKSESTSSLRKMSPAFNEGFVAGGDLILRSLDEIDFHVHSIVLSLASPVFSNMFAIGTQRDVVAVGESAEVLALMLSFVYPRPPRAVTSFKLLKEGIHVADKYQLDNMKTGLREQLSLYASPVSAFTDPLGAFAFAVSHEFSDEVKLSANLASQTYDFRKVDDLIELANAIPAAAPVVQIIGSQSARTTIMSNILFNYHVAPMALMGETCAKLICSKCAPTYLNRRRRSPPEWLARWSHSVFEELLKRPPSLPWTEVFTVGFLNLALYRDRLEPIPDHECSCPTSIGRHRADFETWARRISQCLASRLQEVERLELI